MQLASAEHVADVVYNAEHKRLQPMGKVPLAFGTSFKFIW
jgi:hypothetical protein